MLKMLSTQLTGIFTKIKEKEEFPLEDGARLLAQAVIGEGTIYIKGFGEMEGVAMEALNGPEPMKKTKKLEQLSQMAHTDRVILFTRRSDDQDALSLGKALTKKGIPFVSVAGTAKEANECLSQWAEIHINTHVTKPILPAEDGSRFCFPSLFAALFIYYGIKFNMDEMLDEYE
ncbi:DUF2529 domain-containing protein [Siminovitchia sp. 179-K 8D1 HS]|uniref:DUF2529 domain-containing protein n=1 Tax=Siminovitchia sp. 179-K 8D1 HS TaxID=3142385 RepID=UPI0039A2994D